MLKETSIKITIDIKTKTAVFANGSIAASVDPATIKGFVTASQSPYVRLSLGEFGHICIPAAWVEISTNALTNHKSEVK